MPGPCPLAGPGKTDADAAAIRANHPIPSACGIYYFEAEVISKGRDGYMGIGLCWDNVAMSRLPGTPSRVCGCSSSQC